MPVRHTCLFMHLLTYRGTVVAQELPYHPDHNPDAASIRRAYGVGKTRQDVLPPYSGDTEEHAAPCLVGDDQPTTIQIPMMYTQDGNGVCSERHPFLSGGAGFAVSFLLSARTRCHQAGAAVSRHAKARSGFSRRAC
jgi:hypothetical protein